jgi:hypothetical protein
VGVAATIIDHRELDEAALAAAREARVGADPAKPPAEESFRLPPAAPLASVAEIRRRNEAEDQERRRETLELIDKARRAEAAGKLGVARVYYQMAARRPDETLRRQIGASLTKLNKAADLALHRP